MTKYKVGNWVKIIATDHSFRGNMEELVKKYIGYCLPIIKIDPHIQLPIEDKNNVYLINYNHIIDINNKSLFNKEYFSWNKKDIQIATPKEIKESKLKLAAEAL